MKAPFPVGTAVEYYSSSLGEQWIPAIVQGFSDGYYQLDVHARANPNKVRAPRKYSDDRAPRKSSQDFNNVNGIPGNVPTPSRYNSGSIQRPELGGMPGTMPDMVPSRRRDSARDNAGQGGQLRRSKDFGRPTSASDRLDHLLAPGDVLFVENTGGQGVISLGAEGIMRLGSNGGALGHVLLVSGPPRGVNLNSSEAIVYKNMWPDARVKLLWVVPTLESCRDQEGFHETEYFVYIDEMGQILMQGENATGGERLLTRYSEPQRVQVVQSPHELRDHFQPQIMYGVLADMRNHQASWSWSTAVKAFFFSAEMQPNHGSAGNEKLEEIEKCWFADPICTSVVIVFWQRYLCELARQFHAPAVDWILKWMPLMADRALPANLLSSLDKCGWNYVAAAPWIEDAEFAVKMGYTRGCI